MIATIKSEWRKNRFRPAFLVAGASLVGITLLEYSLTWYQATHTGTGLRPMPIGILYPDQFINNMMQAAYPFTAAIAIVLGALLTGSEYSWGTMKTMLTQSPGRLTTWFGRMSVFAAWMAILTGILLGVGAAYSVAVAAANGHAIVWPAGIDILKGFGAIWLILTVNGSIGLALGVIVRHAAAALGIGLIYVLSVEILAVHFIDSLNGGAYKWIGDLFVGQNSTALTQQFTSPLFGPSIAPSIGAERAVLVLGAYFIGLLIVSSGLLKARDVT